MMQVSEDYQAVNVSVKADIWRSEVMRRVEFLFIFVFMCFFELSNLIRHFVDHEMSTKKLS